MGTVNLLNLSKKYNIRFHQIGTDEVYGETTPEDWLKLDDNELPIIKPSSPYSSSKASADLIALSYFRTFGTNVTISRCSNNFGPYQHTEKLIPTVINKILRDQNIPVYGEGNQKRHWIYVDEHNRAIMNILEKGSVGIIYNIAPLHDNYITNIELIKFILDYTKKSYNMIEHVTDRLGHDVSYYMEANYEFCNSNKHWKDDMIKTINWYTDKITNILI
jgi:dTDP-glucose 4,6-dehydratase